jgi:HSP20 family molecular chaperone IbpA
MSNRLLGKPLHPRVDLIERTSDYRLFLHLPGSAAGDIHLEIENGVFRLTTRVGPEARMEGGARPFGGGNLQLNVDFGDLIAGDELQAVHEHEQGVLLVTLPKA